MEGSSVDILTEWDIVAARQLGRKKAKSIGFDLVDQARITTAISELARNIYLYAEQGKIEVHRIVEKNCIGISIIASDGPVLFFRIASFKIEIAVVQAVLDIIRNVIAVTKVVNDPLPPVFRPDHGHPVVIALRPFHTVLDFHIPALLLQHQKAGDDLPHVGYLGFHPKGCLLHMLPQFSSQGNGLPFKISFK